MLRDLSALAAYSGVEGWRPTHVSLHHLACSPDAHVGCGALLAGSRPELEVKTTS